jgi:radical SAM superfamily enzyme YgiQ (UPF0313 family)
MGSKILLISANRCTNPDPVFPLGLAHLNAALRRAGHDTLWTDSLASAEPIENILTRFQPDYIGISIRNIDDVLIRKRETYFENLPALVAAIRRKTNRPVILGGSGFSIFPGPLLELAGADYGICGEGEAGLTALTAALETGGDLTQVPGLVYRQNGKITANAPAARASDTALTDADWPEAITAHYLKADGVLNVQTQRGCGFRCCYCTYPVIEGRQHRNRPAEIVADEFAQLQRRGAKYVFIVDSVFNSSPGHVTEICEALLRRNVKLAWGCFLRPQALTPELMKLMARAGLSHIEFGSDSFCDDVLAAYQKDFTFADILQSSELAHREKVDFCHYLICGGPGETDATLAAGYEQSLRLQGTVIMAVVGMRVYPGTQLFERAIADGQIRRDTDLLSPAYYLAPGLTQEGVFARLREFARRSPNWIVGDPDPAYTRLVERLRQRGVAGPLWSYFSMIQRLWPQGIPGTARP